jgi:cytochrome c556
MKVVKASRAAILAVAALVVGASGIAVAQTARTPAQTVEYREAQLRRLGAAFKAVNEQSRASTPDFAVIRSNAQTISTLAAEFPSWFPAGTGPAAGLDTKAKAEVWSNGAGFADEIRQFQAAAQNLATASAGTDASAIGPAARALGQRCSSCHTGFRERS